MLQPGEDDWIISQDVKSKVLNRLLVLKETIAGREKEIVERIIMLLELAIRTKKIFILFFRNRI